MAEGQGWVSSGESIPFMEPTPSVRNGGRPPLRLEGIFLGDIPRLSSLSFLILLLGDKQVQISYGNEVFLRHFKLSSQSLNGVHGTFE